MFNANRWNLYLFILQNIGPKLILNDEMGIHFDIDDCNKPWIQVNFTADIINHWCS